MSTFGEDAYFALVQSIYETILNPHEWDKVVAETINITQASTAAIVGFSCADKIACSGPDLISRL
jgi:hypothetical protein